MIRDVGPCCVFYTLLCRPEAVGELLQLALPVLLAGLQDKDDSVQAAAAEALVPLAPLLLQMQIDDVSLRMMPLCSWVVLPVELQCYLLCVPRRHTAP